MKRTQAKYSDTQRSACTLCKPHKRGWEDKRTSAQKKADEAIHAQLKEMGIELRF